ncbi:response regulator [Myxococcus sp. K38C18041901]|uniref:response regulator n=1 Tax=Myxococcus guangdongensis TaxID=2906760 RepID=UPI0020A7E19F|nr:response regulator [Myxococcus guangdongensis]MCP3062058.1 response regulator [Myxococcus guangdongensis]
MLNCVLAVDDDPDILMAFKDVLELEGHRVLLARGGREALELLGQGERPDVILLDLMMPDVNGWEFRDRQLADASLASIPVVVISGQGVSAREVIALGVDDFLRKPVDVERLLGAVSRFAVSREGDSPHV